MTLSKLTSRRPSFWSLGILIFLGLIAGTALAQDASDCLDCHEDEDLTKNVDGRVVSLFLDIEKFEASIHGQEDMDCIDCHNRPTHHYNPPAKLVNKAMALGNIDPSLPGIKGLVVELMSDDYGSTAEALAGIETGMFEFYDEGHPEIMAKKLPDLERSIASVKQLFSTNIFPEMKVSWRDFPDHIGHLTTPGCFRCHDGNHETDEGEVLSRDCNICHTIVAQERKDGARFVSLDAVEYVHPEDIDEEWKETNCSDCHEG